MGNTTWINICSKIANVRVWKPEQRCKALFTWAGKQLASYRFVHFSTLPVQLNGAFSFGLALYSGYRVAKNQRNRLDGVEAS